ncbi:MAG: nucleotide pyrophosphohydrolase [Burkholderiaceae bacterium]
MDIEPLARELRRFADERDWNQFHTPKNLATAISIEASELLELFQWTRGSGSWDELDEPKLRARVQEEIADVILYLIRFADLAGIDLQQVAWAKLNRNAEKYPASKFRGSDRKYNE